MANWDNARLQQLFDEYNATYWSGQLPKYKVRNRALRVLLGLCVHGRQMIYIDVAKHRSDSEISSTLLHEMTHAATPDDHRAHGYAFWAELERLLSREAPIVVGYSEAPGHRLLSRSIPAEFKLCHKAVKRLPVYGVRREPIERLSPAALEAHARRIATSLGPKREWYEVRTVLSKRFCLIGIDGEPIDDASKQFLKAAEEQYAAVRARYVVIESKFVQAAKTITWEKAVELIGSEYGILDILSRPDRPDAYAMADALKKAFSKARREHLRWHLSKRKLNKMRRELVLQQTI